MPQLSILASMGIKPDDPDREVIIRAARRKVVAYLRERVVRVAETHTPDFIERYGDEQLVAVRSMAEDIRRKWAAADRRESTSPGAERERGAT